MYSRLAIEYKQALAKFERENECDLIASRDLSRLYGYVKSRLGSSSKVSTLVDHLGKICTSDKEKSEALNHQFSSVFTLDDDFTPNFETVTEDSVSVKIEDGDVFNLLQNLSSSFAICPDFLPAVFYKKLCSVLYQPLAIVFRISYESGCLPSMWKSAIVIPIPKKGASKKPADFRPVSLTCTPCRLLEALFRNKMIDFLMYHGLISKEQHGFMKQRSTSTQMLECLFDWSSCIGKSVSVDIVYLDLAKAFDSVCHRKLLLKLEKLGIRGRLLAWMSEFLSGRTQRVNVNGCLSDVAAVISGVPQGSVLGPLLFLLYINDMTLTLPNGIVIKLFADDCKVYVALTKPDSSNKLSLALTNIFDWLRSWQLKLSYEKCAVLHLGSRNPRNDYYIGNTIVSRCGSYRDLGIIVDEKLNFREHCNSIIRKAYQRINIIFRSFVTSDPATLNPN